MLVATRRPNKCGLPTHFNEWTRVDFGANLLRFHLVLVDYALWLLRNYDLIVFRVGCLFPWLTLIRIPLWPWFREIFRTGGGIFESRLSFNFTLQLVRINLWCIKSRYRYYFYRDFFFFNLISKEVNLNLILWSYNTPLFLFNRNFNYL